MLDVADDFELAPWLEGLMSVDLDVLSDAPGVDTDRRILRLAFFAELAWRFAIESKAFEKKSGATKSSPASIDNDSSMSTEADVRGTSNTLGGVTTDEEDRLKKGDKVVVLKLDEKGQEPVNNGMEGRIVEHTDLNHYSVSFTNLIEPQILHASNLEQVNRVPREYHSCICGETGGFLCSRCSMMWYCSVECQKKDNERHKINCKAMVSTFGLAVLARQAAKLKVRESSNEDSEESNSANQ